MFASLLLKDLEKLGGFESIKLRGKAEEAAKHKINRLIIAPVYYGEESNTSINEVNTVVEELNAYLKVKGIALSVYPANLIRDNYDSIKEYMKGNLGTINNSNYILLDVKESSTIDSLVEIVFEYRLRNLIPIIVGPEKIEEIIKSNKQIEKLKDENCLFQLDSASLKGHYGKKIKKTAKSLIKKDIYQLVGFEEEIEKNYTTGEIELLGKKGLFVLNPEGALARRIIKNTKRNKKSFLSKVLGIS